MIYEFLYRGPTEQNNNAGSWHVVLGETVNVFGKQVFQTRGPLTPSEAAALGYSLDTVLSAINADALAQIDRLTAELNALKIKQD